MTRDRMDTTPSTFSNARMFEAFKRVRNRIQKHHPLDIALKAMEVLNSPRTAEESLQHYPPHFILLLIKWAFLHGNYCSAAYRVLTPKEFNDIVNLVHDFDRTGRIPRGFEELLRFAKTMSHQQFYLQRSPSKMSWARPYLLFEELNRSVYPRARFEALTGVPLDVFLDLSFVLMSFFLRSDRPTSISPSSFARLDATFHKHVRPFLGALSLRPHEVKTFLKNTTPKHGSWDYELREETPLKRKPLLEINGQYYPYSRSLLMYSLEHFVYDSLREDNPKRFMKKFGPIFEAYLALGIADSGLAYFTERGLRKSLPSGSKVVDYLLLDSDANVLVDAKGVEMHRLGQVSHIGEVIEGKLKSSIISGIIQGNETVSSLRKLRTVGGAEVSGKETYLVVVTYKPMYIGNGRDAIQIIGPDRLKSLNRKVGDPPTIPWNHIYFMSADDFDLLMGAIQKGEKASRLFRKAVAADNNWSSKVWTFSQHVERLVPKLQGPKHVNDAFHRLTERVVDQVCG